ncbi:MAG: hypothetical protein AAFY76_21335, partial [Cyanobacteria bacterium J06649_11]
VNVHLDDTRIVNKVEYDLSTDRFVGFVLPLNDDGTPVTESFQLQTFDEIKKNVLSAIVEKYAHCIVIKSIAISVPSFVLFTICTDSKYDNQIIMKRWSYVSKQLTDLGIIVLSNGADGTGPFLKAMTKKSGLFDRNYINVPPFWSFYWMPQLLSESLPCQDIIHLLAKLRTRLVTPSNLISLELKLRAVVTCKRY